MTRDRVLFPATGFTKADALRYYRAVATSILPYLRKRPLSFKRYPDTINAESFWEKNAPAFTPAWVKRFRVPRRSGEGDIEYIVVDDAKTLLWIADVGGIELHPFLHTVPDIEIATHVVFDLDPGEGADIVDCCGVALMLREALKGIRLESFAKVSGSKGLQVYVPAIAPHAATEPFARIVAEELAKRHPKTITAKMGKQFRRGKVFIDWSQNADYKTTVAVYSLRAKRERPLVSMPVTWAEVKRAKNLEWGPDEAIARIRRRGDLFEGVLKVKQKLAFDVGAAPPRAKAAAKPPHSKTQSGRKLYVLEKDGLWLELHHRLKRWALRPEGDAFIATPAGELPVNQPPRGEETGTFEIVEGGYHQWRFDLWFTGKLLHGPWSLVRDGDEWRLSRERAAVPRRR